MTGLGLGTWNFEIKTFPEVSRPRPEPPGLETKTKTLATRSRDQDQDLSFQGSSELEFETLGLEITSLDIQCRISSAIRIHVCCHHHITFTTSGPPPAHLRHHHYHYQWCTYIVWCAVLSEALCQPSEFWASYHSCQQRQTI